MDLFLAIGIAVAACVLGAVVGYMYRKSHTEKKIRHSRIRKKLFSFI